jgi:SnoaL-like protein
VALGILAVTSRFAGDPSPPEILRRLHSAQSQLYAGGPARALEAVLHPDVSWHVPGRNAIAGHHHGRGAVLSYMTRRRDLADRSFRMKARELLIGPSHFAALSDGTAIIGGVRHEWSTVGLYRAENGQIRECFLIPFDQEAFDRAWSPGSGT